LPGVRKLSEKHYSDHRRHGISSARAEWAAEHLDIDTSPMEIIGRILRAEHLADTLIRSELRLAGLTRLSGPRWCSVRAASGTGAARWPA
jgi:hypothetical protein